MRELNPGSFPITWGGTVRMLMSFIAGLLCFAARPYPRLGILRKIEKDSQWDSNPHAKYPQVLTSWEELNLQRLRNLTLPNGERVCLFRHGKLKRSFSKAIYHVLDNTGQLLPRCFSQRHERVLLIYARTQGCSKPIAGYLPRLSLAVLLTP